MDVFEKCFRFTAAKDAMKAGQYPYFTPMTENEGTTVESRGHKLIMCGSNNYLGLTTHPEVREAAMKAIERFGSSCSGSRFLNGTLELHEELENELATWVGKPAALVFSTGMLVNLGTVSALVGRDDVVILDKEVHASIVDGARLGWGEIRRFRHSNMRDLERTLSGIPENKGKLVAVDGVFSMLGDVAPLPALVKLCRKYGARLLVDDAHGIGVLGKGRGTAAHFKLTNQVDLIMGTFSKSLASLGGFIAGDADIVHYIKHHARSLIFTASMSPANAAAALAALRIMKREPERVERINTIADRMRRGIAGLGFNVGNSLTPIIPIIIGDTLRTTKSWKVLYDIGIFVNAVIPSAVAKGQELLRTSYMATHTDEQLDEVLQAFETTGKQMALI